MISEFPRSAIVLATFKTLSKLLAVNEKVLMASLRISSLFLSVLQKCFISFEDKCEFDEIFNSYICLTEFSLFLRLSL